MSARMMARRRYMTCERFDASLVNVPLPRYKVIMDGFWMCSLQQTVASLLQGACIKQICMGADLFFPFSSTDQTVRLWDLEESPVTCVTILSQTTPIWGVSWHPDTLPQIRENSVSTQMMAPGHQFITASDDGVIRLYRSAGASASE